MYFLRIMGTISQWPLVPPCPLRRLLPRRPLVKQYLKTTDMDEDQLAHAVNCLLMSTATPILDEAHGVYYPVRRQGAGLANAAAAIASQAYIQVKDTNKAKLELGDDRIALVPIP